MFILKRRSCEYISVISITLKKEDIIHVFIVPLSLDRHKLFSKHDQCNNMAYLDCNHSNQIFIVPLKASIYHFPNQF